MVELLDHVQKGDEKRFKDLCKSLKKSGQVEIAEMLCGCQIGRDVRDAVPNDPDDVPLSWENECKMTAIWNKLRDRMTSDEKLLGELLALKVISDLQHRILKAS